MSSVANVLIHRSQFPENIRRDLLVSLRTRRVNHKFHYDSVKQTQKWLALHQAYSPSRHDQDCGDTYERAFREATKLVIASRVHLVGLGCGGGQKDTRLLRRLKARRRELFYTPSDVSVAMTLVAQQAATAVLPEARCFPLVCDLATASDLPAALDLQLAARSTRLLTFFGMIPNFEPQRILPRLAALVRRKDLLLFSANLAPGENYATGLQKILPQYDNALTCDWLFTFLSDLGIAATDGRMRFTVEDSPSGGLKKVVARFHFTRSRRVAALGERFQFHAGEAIQLFFSYRYTPALVRKFLGRHGLSVRDEWITKSGEEGIFLCQRQGA